MTNEQAGWLNHGDFTGDVKHEISVFQKFLAAFFDLPYVLINREELLSLSSLAAYYLAIQKVSNSISAAIFNSPCLAEHLQQPSARLIKAAFELGHKELFFDLMIAQCGNITKDPVTKDVQEVLPQTVQSTMRRFRARLFEKITTVQQHLMFDLVKEKSYRETLLYGG